MSSKIISFSSLALILLAIFSGAAAHYASTKYEFAVEGVVYCQGCSCVGSWSLEEKRPLDGAKVSIRCKDEWNRVLFYKAAETDKNGYFIEELAFATKESFDPTKSCSVRLLASPDSDCNLLTNVNYGIQGARPRKTNETYGTGIDVYAAGPFAFKPRKCAPRTHY